jgi:hypothetical protein
MREAVQFRVKAQFRGCTVTDSRAVNPLPPNDPSRRCVNVCPPASGPNTAVATKLPSPCTVPLNVVPPVSAS